MTDDPMFRAALQSFLEQLSSWRRAHRAGDAAEDDVRRVLAERFENLTDAIEGEVLDHAPRKGLDSA